MIKILVHGLESHQERKKVCLLFFVFFNTAGVFAMPIFRIQWKPQAALSTHAIRRCGYLSPHKKQEGGT